MLRLLSKNDLPQVIAIEKLIQLAPWTEEIFNRCWEAGYRGWAIEETNNVIGFILVSFQAGEAHILNLGVHPDYQRCGYGEQLMRQVLSHAQAKEIATCFLEVRRSNVKAIALYEKLGFIQFAERKEYYASPEGREDALLFAKDLTVQ